MELKSDDKYSIEKNLSESRITIKNVDKDDGGKYSVEIRNNHGEVCQDYFVFVDSIPSPPCGKPIAEKVSGSILVRWPVLASSLHSPITGYTIEICNTKNRNSWKRLERNIIINSFLVSGLEKNMSYAIRIRAENSVGISEPGAESDPFNIDVEGMYY